MSVLTEQQKSKAFWGGTARGTLKGVLIGVAIGVIAATTLYLGIGFFEAGGFEALTDKGANAAELARKYPLSSTFGGFLLKGSELTMLPMIIFNSVLGGVAGMLNSGKQAVAALEAKVERVFNQQKLQQLEAQISQVHHHGRAHAQAITQQLSTQQAMPQNQLERPAALAENIEHEGRITGVQSRMIH